MEEQENYQSKVLLPFGRPTITKNLKHDVLGDVKELHSALKFITNKQRMIDVLCVRTSRERIEIAKAFKTCYDQDLVDETIRKTSGDFRDLLVAMLTPMKEFYCRELYDALNRTGTDEDTLIEILVTLSNQKLFEINQRYSKQYGKSLEMDLKADTIGSFKKLLVSLSNGTRDESGVIDVFSARNDAMDMKRAGIDKWGTDASVFNRVLCLRNFDQINLIAQQYEVITGHSLEKDIKSEFSGDIKDGLLAIIRVSRNRAEFFARCLYKSMVGLGTNDKDLIRLVVTRCEIDMLDIKEDFEQKYGKSLKSFVEGDTSGYYKKALLKLIGE